METARNLGEDPPNAIMDFFDGVNGTAIVAIVGATSNAYTPGADDIGKQLVAVARYMDRTEDTDNVADADDAAAPDNAEEADFDRFDNIAVSPTTAPVIDDPANSAPEFVEGATAVRYVEEDNDSDRPSRPSETIGAPLAVDDADMPNDSHTFTLSGNDANSFSINAANGQLMTNADAPLDYDGSKKSYTVVVTVKDGSGEPNDTDRITVTIQVKGLDEKPVITGDTNFTYEENDTGPVGTLRATDPERVTPIYWSLLEDDITVDLPGGLVGDDVDDIAEGDFVDFASFDVEDGVLMFNEAPDFENPTDVDGGADVDENDNIYKVVVRASDGGSPTGCNTLR